MVDDTRLKKATSSKRVYIILVDKFLSRDVPQFNMFPVCIYKNLINIDAVTFF